MSKEKFTQGEWSVPPHAVGPAEQCEVIFNEAGECIAEYVHSRDDANLIAAAPDGFRLGVLVMDLCGQPSGVDEQQSDLLYEAALEFIKKARGE